MRLVVPKRLLMVALVSAAGVVLRAWSKKANTATLDPLREASQEETQVTRNITGTGMVTERYLLYFVVPLWVVAGTLDYIWHKRTKIETTSGTLESVIHALMMAEAGLPLLLGLLLEINAGVMLLMVAAFFTHAATAFWDVSFAVERRKVLPNEQHIHSLLEVLPFCAVSFVICLHWKQFASLFGAADEKPQFLLRKKNPPLPGSYLAGFLGAVSINGTAYAEEIIRCLRAQQKGLTGTETPKAAKELYASA